MWIFTITDTPLALIALLTVNTPFIVAVDNVEVPEVTKLLLAFNWPLTFVLANIVVPATFSVEFNVVVPFKLVVLNFTKQYVNKYYNLWYL